MLLITLSGGRGQLIRLKSRTVTLNKEIVEQRAWNPGSTKIYWLSEDASLRGRQLIMQGTLGYPHLSITDAS